MSGHLHTIGTSGASALEDIYPIVEACGLEILCHQEGYVRCPGFDTHTTPDAESDCKVFNNGGIPRLYCFHQHCREAVAEKNIELFCAARAASCPRHVRACKYHELIQKRVAEYERLREEGRRKLAEILRDYPWPASQIPLDLPEDIDIPEADYWRVFMVVQFKDEDIVWCGRDVQDSGSPNHRWRFRPVGEWLKWDHCPGTHICPNVFKLGVHSRSNANIVSKRYLVVESDILGHDQIAAVFRWLDSSVGLPLRAIVDTANRSLHGWFDYPKADLLADLKTRLPLLGCDPALFTPSQPVRLPGALRDGRYQRLLYINPKP